MPPLTSVSTIPPRWVSAVAATVRRRPVVLAVVASHCCFLFRANLCVACFHCLVPSSVSFHCGLFLNQCRENKDIVGPTEEDHDCCGNGRDVWCADGYWMVFGWEDKDDGSCWPNAKGYKCLPAQQCVQPRRTFFLQPGAPTSVAR